MKAVLIDAVGAAPRVGTIDPPERGPGQTLLKTLAVALNPIDRAVASGVFYGGHPPHPYVLGSEVVGEVISSDTWPIGAVVWACGGGLGTTRSGCLGDNVVIQDEQAEPVPSGLRPEVAVAMGQAGLTGWLATTWCGGVTANDTVLVLGATGSVGLAAVQAARIAGAGTIVGVGRQIEALQRAGDAGATAVVELSADATAEEIAQQFLDAGGPPTLVIDPLWGVPGVAAIMAADRQARIVQLGQSAGASASLTSASIRGKQLSVLGFSILAVPPEVRGAGYAAIARAALAGQIQLDVRQFPIDDIGAAWQAASVEGTGKVVVTIE